MAWSKILVKICSDIDWDSDLWWSKAREIDCERLKIKGAQ